ncbi:putative Inner membrane protein yohK [uncultured Pleomorphomonas sp.]|uniref:Putative Inner membrane protein yohK n=1 Tax=uncultured Pleomorphomonas sp. TaxID=442121 RepID=A0A212LE44_9HYPH|nr:LrgB family protein [uncultured Pleomorphomonas sp.]SCM75629.1 putative Inner membrane protein yohK [uncultured Pleomorphomonas sp.]
MTGPGLNAMDGLWAHLSGGALLWLTLTLGVYAIADRLSLLVQRNPLANPVLHSVWVIGVILVASGTPYQTYFDGAYFIHFLLGPSTVALALPLYENRRVVMRSLVPIVAALLVGSIATIGSVIICAAVFDLPAMITISSLPKSATSGVAMGISQSVGGDASLTAILVVATGIVGAVMATPLLNLLRIEDRRARGFAVGLAAHGVGTARAFQVHPLTGTFAGVAMSLNGLMTAVLVPLAASFIGG